MWVVGTFHCVPDYTWINARSRWTNNIVLKDRNAAGHCFGQDALVICEVSIVGRMGKRELFEETLGLNMLWLGGKESAYYSSLASEGAQWFEYYFARGQLVFFCLLSCASGVEWSCQCACFDNGISFLRDCWMEWVVLLIMKVSLCVVFLQLRGLIITDRGYFAVNWVCFDWWISFCTSELCWGKQ